MTRMTLEAAATTASPTSPRRHLPVGSRCRSRSSPISAYAQVTTSLPTPADGACARARRSNRLGRCAAALRPGKWNELLGRRVPALDVGPRRLLHAVVGDQALLVNR